MIPDLDSLKLKTKIKETKKCKIILEKKLFMSA